VNGEGFLEWQGGVLNAAARFGTTDFLYLMLQRFDMFRISVIEHETNWNGSTNRVTSAAIIRDFLNHDNRGSGDAGSVSSRTREEIV
jgi:hypothetical protein